MLYLTEGDYINAGLSALSIIPGADAFTKTGKASKVLGNGIVESGLKHLDNVADGIKKLVKKADDAIDLEKHLPKKLLKEEAEAFAKKADKVADDVVEDAAKAIKSGTPSIGRMDLAGKTHPVSGVKFDSNGFPIFESKYNTKLDPQDYLKSRGTHFDRASKALYNDIMNDSNLRSKFTEAEIAIFKDGGVPKAYTWHHHQDEGVMQLVDRKIHRQTGHTGGFSIWGPGN